MAIQPQPTWFTGYCLNVNLQSIKGSTPNDCHKGTSCYASNCGHHMQPATSASGQSKGSISVGSSWAARSHSRLPYMWPETVRGSIWQQCNSRCEHLACRQALWVFALHQCRNYGPQYELSIFDLSGETHKEKPCSCFIIIPPLQDLP